MTPETDTDEMKRVAKIANVGAEASFNAQLIMYGELLDVLMAKNILSKQDVANMASKWEDFSSKAESDNPPLAHFLRLAARQFHSALALPISTVN